MNNKDTITEISIEMFNNTTKIIEETIKDTKIKAFNNMISKLTVAIIAEGVVTMKKIAISGVMEDLRDVQCGDKILISGGRIHELNCKADNQDIMETNTNKIKEQEN